MSATLLCSVLLQGFVCHFYVQTQYTHNVYKIHIYIAHGCWHLVSDSNDKSDYKINTVYYICRASMPSRSHKVQLHTSQKSHFAPNHTRNVQVYNSTLASNNICIHIVFTCIA